MTALTELSPLQMTDYLEVAGPDEIRVKGHRFGLEHIVERYREGLSPEEITQFYPGLALGKAYAIIAYYLANREVVDAYIARVDALAEAAYQAWSAQPPSPVMQRMRAIRERQLRKLQRDDLDAE